MNNFNPDWRAFYPSKEEIENNLYGFKFTGIGWYESKTDTILILNSENKDPGYWVYVWNHSGAKKGFEAIIDLPYNWIERLNEG